MPNPDPKISKFMTDRLVTVAPDLGARQAFFKMRRDGVRHLLVVDADNKLLGIVSDRDLRRPDWVDEAIDLSHVYKLDDHLHVSDVMTAKVVTVRTYERATRAVKLLLEHRINALPVLNKDDELVGIISATDLLRLLDEVLSSHYQGS